jgi:hypothetical protein
MVILGHISVCYGAREALSSWLACPNWSRVRNLPEVTVRHAL